MERPGELVRRTFRSLRVRNYRLYFFGQVVSMSGTWMQSVAQNWLVVQLGGSGVDLGVTVGLQFGPALVLGPWAGVLADRVDKRRLLVATQVVAGLLALALGLLAATGAATVPLVWLLAAATGVVTALDMPSRQSFVYEMVGPDDLANAVGLNAVVINSSRIVGPAVAGLLIATAGVAPCFFVNAASYVAVIAALLLMRTSELWRTAPQPRRPGQLRAGLACAWRTCELRVPLLMMAVVSTLAYNFSVVLPLLTRQVYGRGGGAYGALTAAMGVGALAGALLMAARRRPSFRLLVGSTLGFGLASLALAASPGYGWGLVAMAPLGAAGVLFISTTNALLQLNADGAMRGRVMALWSMVFLGSTPIGGPLTGLLARLVGVRWTVALGGLATLATAAAAAWVLRRRRLRAGECAAPPCLPDTPAHADLYAAGRPAAGEVRPGEAPSYNR